MFSRLIRKIEEIRKPDSKDFLDFFRQIRMFTRAGISIVDGLRIMYGQCKNVMMKKAVAQMMVDGTNGVRFSEALKKHSFFPSYYVYLIYSGEETGTLDDFEEKGKPIKGVFSEIVLSCEQSEEIDRQVASGVRSLRTFLIGAFVVFCMAVFVLIPKFADILKDLRTELPAITSMVLKLGLFFPNHWFLNLSFFVFCFLGYRFFCKNYPEKRDRLLFKIPIYSKVYKLEMQYRFVKIFSLVSRGVAFSEGLRLTALSISNIPLKNMLLASSRHVENGMSVFNALEKVDVERFISNSTLAMIRAGEESGQLIEILSEIADKDYRENLLSETKTIGEEMFMKVGIPVALALAVVFGSVYYPIIKIMGAAQMR